MKINPKSHLLQIAALLALLFILPACKDDKVKEPETRLELYPASITLLDNGGEQSFTVMSSADWFIAGKPDWVKLSTSAGYGDRTVTVSADPNPNFEERKATLMVCTSNGKKTAQLTVTQAKKGVSLVVSSQTVTLEDNDDWDHVDVVCNTEWTVGTPSASWVEVEKQWDDKEYAYYVAISTPELNWGSTNREATFDVIAGDQKVTVKVIQQPTLPEIRLYDFEKEQTVGQGKGEKGSFDVYTNFDVSTLSIKCEAGWLKVTTTADPEYSKYYTAVDFETTEANPSTSARKATITLTGKGVTEEVTVTQEGKEAPKNLDIEVKHLATLSNSIAVSFKNEESQAEYYRFKLYYSYPSNVTSDLVNEEVFAFKDGYFHYWDGSRTAGHKYYLFYQGLAGPSNTSMAGPIEVLEIQQPSDQNQPTAEPIYLVSVEKSNATNDKYYFWGVESAPVNSSLAPNYYIYFAPTYPDSQWWADLAPVEWAYMLKQNQYNSALVKFNGSDRDSNTNYFYSGRNESDAYIALWSKQKNGDMSGSITVYGPHKALQDIFDFTPRFSAPRQMLPSSKSSEYKTAKLPPVTRQASKSANDKEKRLKDLRQLKARHRR